MQDEVQDAYNFKSPEDIKNNSNSGFKDLPQNSMIQEPQESP